MFKVPAAIHFAVTFFAPARSNLPLSNPAGEPKSLVAARHR